MILSNLGKKLRTFHLFKADGTTPATIDGAPVFNVTSGDITIVPVDNDSLDDNAVSAYIVSGKEVGDFGYDMVVDADMGEGVTSVTIPFTVTVFEAGFAKVNVEDGEEELK